MKAGAVLTGFPFRSSTIDPDVEITGLSIDSRKCGKGELFFARKGYKVDGEQFVSDAIEAGSAGIVAERDFPGIPTALADDVREALAYCALNFYKHPDRALDLIGVTGTNGKTTTAWFIQHVLQSTKCCGLLSTVENFDGKNRTHAVLTTPEAHDIGDNLARMRGNGCDRCVMEVSAHSVTLKRIFGLNFKVGVFTNLSQDHLDFYGDMETYFKAKKKFFDNLGPDACAVINIDDPAGERLLDNIRCRIISVSPAGRSADVRVMGTRSGDAGVIVLLNAEGKGREVDLPLPGLHNAANLASCVGVLLALRMDPFSSLSLLASMPPIPGRMEAIPSRDGVRYFVDFAHTPDGLEKVLGSPDIHEGGSVFCVFGCGGDRDRGKRPLMMRAVCDNADVVIATSDNPRTEDQKQIFRDMEAGEAGNRKVLYIEDRREAIRAAVDEAKAGDVVIVAGKGHETYQLIGKERFPFSDADEINQALKEAGRVGQ
ncbi:MAG: UDP-N-acetylmuramoyl-L-alanyl-D-glutamate--2,6-diaminopimelate ligase [Acidobacteria bacterium]|nr:UDP-N-acetylmuramoyl-L-alanyl-D-glutamate--2,6-diaminopimelate ligase [Acidobacteriota bacterium]